MGKDGQDKDKEFGPIALGIAESLTTILQKTKSFSTSPWPLKNIGSLKFIVLISLLNLFG